MSPALYQQAVPAPRAVWKMANDRLVHQLVTIRALSRIGKEPITNFVSERRLQNLISPSPSQPSFLHFSLLSAALWHSANSRPVYSLMLSSHLILCLLCLLPPFTMPCKMVLARPDERETCPYHFSLHLFAMVRRSSCGPIASWILARTSSLTKWSFMRCVVSCGSTSFPWLVFFLQLCQRDYISCSAVRIHNSQAYRKTDVTRERISPLMHFLHLMW